MKNIIRFVVSTLSNVANELQDLKKKHDKMEEKIKEDAVAQMNKVRAKMEDKIRQVRLIRIPFIRPTSSLFASET